MMTSRPRGPLYVGLTNDLVRRVYEHRNGLGGRHTRRYTLTNLAWLEGHETIEPAIIRENRIKRWPAWKIELVEGQNPTWRDLFFDIV